MLHCAKAHYRQAGRQHQRFADAASAICHDGWVATESQRRGGMTGGAVGTRASSVVPARRQFSEELDDRRRSQAR
jgi:hypothetical protein